MNKQSNRYVYSGPGERRIDLVLSELMAERRLAEELTRSQIKRLIGEGCVTVDGRVVKKAGALIKPGGTIELSRLTPSSPEPVPFELALEIIYEDAGLIVLDKPAGLTVHPGAGNRGSTLVNALAAHFQQRRAEMPETVAKGFPAKERAGLVHRLDRDTTGLMVVAKTVSAHNGLAVQFAKRSAERAYLALVFSTPRARRIINTQDAGSVEGNLARHPQKRKEMSVAREGGRRAVTNWRVLRRMPYGCLVECRLETGRTHQIRVHMNHIGSPVIGDRVYGDFQGLPVELRREQEKFGRQALHSAVLGFIHPDTGKKMRFESNPPADMQRLIEVFENYGA